MFARWLIKDCRYLPKVKWYRGYAQSAVASHKRRNRREAVILPKFISVSHLASLLNVRFPQLQHKMESLGYAETHADHIVDDENAQLIAEEFGISAEIDENHGDDLYPSPLPDHADASMKSRPPVIALMGHVDHGKTTLLDYFRKSNIVESEKGGITQHIGAFSSCLRSNSKQKICFLDTPGHEAFLKLRQRGANLTDIVLLVVAADDSVMPQTKEAIKHAKASGVPIVVAITKVDKNDADPKKVIADLASAGVDVEDYGGETQCIPVSAPANKGMEDLESALMALIDILDVKAPVTGNVEGVVVESQQVKGLGNAATIIVRRGTLTSKTTFLVAGTTWAKVRQMTSDQGKPLKEAPPGTPLRLSGWKDLPEPGDTILQSAGEEQCKAVSATRQRLLEKAQVAKQVEVINQNKRLSIEEAKQRTTHDKRAALGLQDVVTQDEKSRDTDSETKEKIFIVKADVGGSAEAVTDAISQIGSDEIRAKVLFSAVGPVTENDIFRAQTANASIISFATPVSRPMERLAEKHKVDLKRYDVIYKVIESVTASLISDLKPQITRKVVSTAEVRQVFEISVKRSSIKVAGIKVSKGNFTLKTLIQVKRGDEIVHEGKLNSIKHGKDSIEEAHKGSEYGVGFENWNQFEEGDVIEGYEEIEVPRYL